MFAFTTLLSLALSTPVIMTAGLVIKRAGQCDVSTASITNLPAALPAPTFPLSYVAVAIGTQNYTCGSAGTYTNVGALAELYDISCIHGTPLFDSIQDQAIAAWSAAPSSSNRQSVISTVAGFSAPVVLGEHFYVTNPVTGSGLNPEWDFGSKGFVVVSKVVGTSAPTGSQDIDWVFLKELTGSLAQQVYRTDTRLGQPPATCTPGSPDIAIKYSAKYWLFG